MSTDWTTEHMGPRWRLRRYASPERPAPAAEMPPELKERLRMLGYVE